MISWMLLEMRRTRGGSAGKSLRSLRVLAQRLGYDVLRPLLVYIGNTGSCGLQVKYFKEKRVMEYNRDKTIEKIKKEDSERRTSK